ncbi:hypothetical protein VTJ49DRAFT_4871 [Mycothermus thermophilus]|uniref:LPXTG-domain-containing protein n=1 Tax=Humicola insolens TaxID=85995 RepID=A0ABR3V4B5_HUMIN
MARSTLLFALWTTCHVSSALQVTPNSPCASVCMDSPDLDASDPNSSTTKNSDIPCVDSDYSSPMGTKFKNCMTCLQTSTFSQGSESDIKWFLYNLRYAASYCVFGHPNGTGFGSSPCTTDASCGRLAASFEHGIPDPKGTTAYSYCSAANGQAMDFDNYERCVPCISADGTHEILANFFVALEAGCRQQPAPGVPLGLNDTIFSATTQVGIVDPSDLLKDNESQKPPLPVPVIIGIVAGAVIVLLIISATTFICLRKRRNRRARASGHFGFYPRPQRRSSMSFQCQTHMVSPRFWPDASASQDFNALSPAVDDEQQPTPARRSSIYKPPTLEEDQPQQPGQEEPQEYEKSITKKAALASVPLHQISTTLPPVSPPPQAHCYSPFSPASTTDHLIRSPLSADSARSTSALLPSIKPYVPAEHGVLTSSAAITTTTPASPASTYAAAGSASPQLLGLGLTGTTGRGWPLPEPRQSHASALSPPSPRLYQYQHQQPQPQPQPQAHHHQYFTSRDTNTTPTTPAFPTRDRDRDRDRLRVASNPTDPLRQHPAAAATLTLTTSRSSSSGLLVSMGRKSPKPGGGGGGSATGSPVESVEIQTAFAAPPRTRR